MWTSVPQIVVNVRRMTASPAPARGRATSRTSIRFGATKTFARIVPLVVSPLAPVKGKLRSGVDVVVMKVLQREYGAARRRHDTPRPARAPSGAAAADVRERPTPTRSYPRLRQRCTGTNMREHESRCSRRISRGERAQQGGPMPNATIESPPRTPLADLSTNLEPLSRSYDPPVRGPVLLASAGNGATNATFFLASALAERFNVGVEVAGVLEPYPVLLFGEQPPMYPPDF